VSLFEFVRITDSEILSPDCIVKKYLNDVFSFYSRIDVTEGQFTVIAIYSLCAIMPGFFDFNVRNV